MTKKIFLIALFAILFLGLYSQRPTMELTFTAVDNASYVQLESIKVMNRTQGCDTLIYWPDTMLSFNYIGIPQIYDENLTFKVFQNYPNPVAEKTTVSLYVPQKDMVSIMVTDIMGRMIVKSEQLLDAGKHSFWFAPGTENPCFFTARWQGQSSSIKILQSGLHIGRTARLEYTGSENYFPQLKALNDIQAFSFSPGDELLYIGYANGFESGMLDVPQESQTYAFQFATNIPCPGTPTVDYEGQVYNTIQILSQCWLKENLNVGTMIAGTEEMTDNGILEKYCYNNEPDNCTNYGGLYQWPEMMQYNNQPGTPGICPPGWHLPSDEEWKILEGSVDSQYGIGDNTWDNFGYRGLDAGTNLKANSGWHLNGNGTDIFGFMALPGGMRHTNGYFFDISVIAYWGTSTEKDLANMWCRYLSYSFPEAPRYGIIKGGGYNVRCLRDD